MCKEKIYRYIFKKAAINRLCLHNSKNLPGFLGLKPGDAYAIFIYDICIKKG